MKAKWIIFLLAATIYIDCWERGERERGREMASWVYTGSASFMAIFGYRL